MKGTLSGPGPAEEPSPASTPVGAGPGTHHAARNAEHAEPARSPRCHPPAEAWHRAWLGSRGPSLAQLAWPAAARRLGNGGAWVVPVKAAARSVPGRATQGESAHDRAPGAGSGAGPGPPLLPLAPAPPPARRGPRPSLPPRPCPLRAAAPPAPRAAACPAPPRSPNQRRLPRQTDLPRSRCRPRGARAGACRLPARAPAPPGARQWE